MTYLYQDDYADAESLPPHVPFQAKPIPRSQHDDAETPNKKLASRMMANAGVFWLADYLNIRDLKTKAQQKFQSAVFQWSATPLDDLPAIIDAVWDATSDDDLGFRDRILSKCAPLHNEILKHDGCVQAMKEHGEFGVDMFRAVAEYYECRLRIVHNKYKSAENQLSKFKAEKRLHYWNVLQMNRTMNIVHEDLDCMIKKRLLNRGDGGATIGNNGKQALRQDIEKVRNRIKPYGAVDEWPDFSGEIKAQSKSRFWCRSPFADDA